MKPGVFSTPALLLRSTAYSESDQILTLYTRDLGKVSCMAKRSRPAGRRFGACLRPFCRFEARIRVRAGQSLMFLEEALESDSYPALLGDLDRMTAGWRLLELVDKLEEPGSAHSGLFDLLDLGLAGLNRDGGMEAGLQCEAGLVALNGWAPRLDVCVRCQREPSFRPLRFSLAEGGLICPDCGIVGAAIVLQPAQWAALRTLFEGGSGPVTAAKAPLDQFIQYQIGKSLRSGEFEGRLKGL